MESEAYRTLVKALRRYVRDEIPGRSFLISGHRGAGKTTLVREAVEQVGDEVFASLQSWARARNREGRTLPPQRPLLVKLHGPSLVEEELPSPGGGEAPKSETSTSASAKITETAPFKRRRMAGPLVEVNVGGADARSDQTEHGDGAETRATSTNTAHAALVQITIGLYRALAREVADAIAIRARDLGGDLLPDRLELAAQLRLELDRAADPGRLRGCWESLEALAIGVLWPLGVADAVVAGVPDQGLREIVAVATAAQAFQVCSGAVTYNQTRKDSAAVERAAETRVGFDLKDAAARALALGIGGLLGWGIAGATGAGIGLVGSLAVSATTRRSNRREQTEDYTFLVDRSIQTLERDLPLVIDRVRQAGLAPVFMVDELDKLKPKSAGTGTSETVRELINRLKHLTTDYGFFCFLTGRDYFDEVQSELASKPFPEEHTYFSERLFVLYRPEEFAGFARRLIVPEPGNEQDEFAAHVLSRCMVHASRLNTIDFVRQLARNAAGSDSVGRITAKSSRIVSSTHFLIPAAIQIAVEQVLDDARFRERLERDGSFRQMAIDVVYRVSRDWSDNKSGIDTSEAALARYLLSRMGIAEVPVADAVAMLRSRVSDSDIEILRLIQRRLITSLINFPMLLIQESTPLDVSVLNAVRDREINGLVSAPNVAGVCAFAFTSDGVTTADAVVQKSLLHNAAIAIDAKDALENSGILLDDLRVIGWPLSLSDEAVHSMLLSFSLARPPDSIQESVDASEIVLLRLFLAQLTSRAKVIGFVAALGAEISREARLPGRPALRVGDAIATLERHLEVGSTGNVTFTTPQDIPEYFVAMPFPLPGKSDQSSREWRDWLDRLKARYAAPPNVELAVRQRRSWTRWAARARAFINERAFDDPGRVWFDDLVLNAAHLLPSRVMHRDLARVTRAEWSALALAGAQAPLSASEAVPVWALIASLRILGFPRHVLMSVLNYVSRRSLDSPGEWPDDDIGFATELAEGAVDGAAGTFILLGPDGEAQAATVTGPSILLRESQLPEYENALEWLTGHGAFRTTIDGPD